MYMNRRRTIKQGQYIDGRQRIILLKTGGNKIVINGAYDRKLSAQIKVFK